MAGDAMLIDFAPMNRPLRLKHCEGCGHAGVERIRQLTAYHDEESNWVWHCELCQAMADEHWTAMWAEYRSSMGI